MLCDGPALFIIILGLPYYADVVEFISLGGLRRRSVFDQHYLLLKK